jgi:hypothetical protein
VRQRTFEEKTMRTVPALVTIAALLCAAAATAAERGGANAVYQRDRAACLRGDTTQDRETCLREAGAARVEARRGGLTEGQGELERNQLLRCEQQPAADREACIRRMRGEGTTSGSVEGGGIIRELVVPVPAQRN